VINAGCLRAFFQRLSEPAPSDESTILHSEVPMSTNTEHTRALPPEVRQRYIKREVTVTATRYPDGADIGSLFVRPGQYLVELWYGTGCRQVAIDAKDFEQQYTPLLSER
jgi:hypothetical protein